MVESEEQVILVDGDDSVVGAAGKLEAHEKGELHRAFSVFIVNSRGELLLQRRAAVKYHGAGLWSNSCCGHPRPGERTADAARRRLREELGIECALEPVFTFTYRAAMAGGLTEHEVDHVFVGFADGDPIPNPAEVDGWRWQTPEAILRDLGNRPADFTPWLPLALEGFLARRMPHETEYGR